MMLNKRPGATALAPALARCCAAAGSAQAAVTIIINNTNAPGVGFNDATPALPVGGNPGTTLGEQRLNAFTYAADIWGQTLTSAAPILIDAGFTPLTCTATGAVLGSAGATQVFGSFPGAQKKSIPGTRMRWPTNCMARKFRRRPECRSEPTSTPTWAMWAA